jgi:GTP-binding protein HflX
MKKGRLLQVKDSEITVISCQEIDYISLTDMTVSFREGSEEQAKVTLELLKELGCEGIPVVTVFNKCDKVPYINELDTSGEAVKISAKNGTGIDSLLAAIQKALPENSVRCRLLLPFDKAGLVNTIRQEGRIFSENYTAEGIVLDALVAVERH